MRDDKISRLFLCSSFILSSFIALPLHASPKEDLEQTQQRIEQARERQSELARQTQQLEMELRELQQQLVATAQAVQAGETDLTVTEEKLDILSDQTQRRQVTLEERQKHLSALISAALKLSQTPPEAVLLMPGESGESIKAARALVMASRSIRQEIAGIKLQMAELEQLKEKVAANRSEYSRKQAGLDKIRQALRSKIAARQGLQEKVGRERKQQADKLEQLAQKTKDLQQLISTLARAEKSKKRKGQLRSFAEAMGAIRLPAAGKVARRFGVATGRNETSKGITFETRAGAQVTAPFDGEVVFTGPFLNYGKLVILRHSDDFHTLLAGLSKIDVASGEFLLEGEPIGGMGDRSPATRLYVELRKNNQPIDPAPWMNVLIKNP
jgi:murein hydrolase activator